MKKILTLFLFFTSLGTVQLNAQCTVNTQNTITSAQPINALCVNDIARDNIDLLPGFSTTAQQDKIINIVWTVTGSAFTPSVTINSQTAYGTALSSGYDYGSLAGSINALLNNLKTLFPGWNINMTANGTQVALTVQNNSDFTYSTGTLVQSYIAPTSGTFSAKIDHAVVSSQVLSYSSTIDGLHRPLDKNTFAPGTIGSNVDIGPTGAATYQMPILVSPGTMGMQPNLGIAYSSQSGNDILGFGWHLTGLSVISRTNKNPYYDGAYASIGLGAITGNKVDDGLMLDGQRLILNPNATNTWSPENDPYTFVTYDGNKFTVTSKDGVVMEYGNNYNSNNAQFIVAGSSQPTAWGIDKITDPNGNYVEFIYSNTNNEYHISSINYTGNSISGAKPFNSVYFYYDKRWDTNTNYVAGGGLNTTELLTGIKVFAEGVLSKDYRFTYAQDRVCSKLVQIALTADGISYNPTVVNWGAAPNYTNVPVTNAGMGSLASNQLYFGDFNGDGKTDYAQFDKNRTITVQIYGGTSYSILLPPTPRTYDTIYYDFSLGKVVKSHNTETYDPRDISVADWNNDGKDEIIVHCSKHSLDQYVADYNTGGFIRDVQTYPDEITPYTFNGSAFSALSMISNSNLQNPSKLFFADINNDGVMDRFSIDGNNNLLGYIGSSITPISITSNVDNIRLLDFDGDGTLEVLALMATGYGSIWKYNGSAFTKVFGDDRRTTTFFGKSADLFVGDFNGDGETDYLTYNNGWKLYYGTGTGFIAGTPPDGLSNYAPSASGTLNTTTGQWSAAMSVTIADMNNDGKSDIIYALNGNVTVCLSTGNSFLTAYGTTTSTVSDLTGVVLYVADVNNDGQKDIIYGNDDKHYTSAPVTSGTGSTSVHEAYKTINSPAMYNGQYVSSVTDGTNVNTAFTYTQTSTYSAGVRSYPVIPIKAPMYLATNLTTKDLNTGVISRNSTCSFQDGYIHALGKGFLGFTKFTSTEALSNATATITFSNTINDGAGNTCFYTWSSNQTVSRNGVAISSTTNTMQAKGGSITNKLFLPLVISSVTTDNLKGFTTTNSMVTFNATQGRVTDQKTVTSDGWTLETQPTYENGISNVSGNVSRLTQLINIRKLGSDTYTSTATYSYDASYPLRLISQTAQGKATTQYISFDGYGNITSTKVSVADGTPARSTSCTYDNFGRFKVSSTDITGYISTASYRSTDGAILKKTDPNFNSVTYFYSAGGNSVYTSATMPDGNVSTTTISWDDSNTSLIKTAKSITNGSTETAYVNALGQTLKETTNSGLNGATLTKTYAYNTDGSIYTSTDPAGKITTYQYWPEGRTKSVVGLNLNTTYSYSGNTSTVTDNILNQTKTTTIDALGNVTQVSGTTGTVAYSYWASGKPNTITTGGLTTSMTYDPLTLDQLTLTDPNAGTTVYTYNGFGQLLTQKDALGTKVTNVYDDYGRLKSKSSPANGNVPASSYGYNYSTTQGSLGMLQNATHDNITETYAYDGLSRVSSITTTTTGLWPDGNQPVPLSYTYNNKGQLAGINYPSGLSVNYVYDGVGNLQQINNAADNSKIWSGDATDALGRWTQYSMGNGLTTKWGYDPSTLMLNSIQTGTATNGTSIQNLGFTFNTAGQLTARNETIGTVSLSESFRYDAMNRLTFSQVASGPQYNYVFKDNGNIDNTSLTGAYSYDPNHPHAVNNVAVTTNNGTSTQFTTTSTYNVENKTLSIFHSGINNGYRDDFTYGVDGNRFRVDFKTSAGVLQSTKIYLGNTEFGYNASGANVYKRTIIKAPTGVCAVYEDNGSTKKIYYIHTDYLGSWLAITDNTGSLINRYSYDAWGRPRDPGTWALKTISTANALLDLNNMQPMFDRGYTGHEIMAGFGLINMNGRLYDPYLQRFLSPDQYVQEPGDAQSFNRYTYCMNNPLMYTDPSGYTWFSRFGDWLGSTGIKLLTTIVSVGAAVVVTVATGGADLILAGVVGGVVGGVTSTALHGGTGSDYFCAAVGGAVMGGASGFVTAGIAAGISYGLNNVYYGAGGFSTIGTYSNWSLASYLPSFGQLFSRVSNGSLADVVFGTVISEDVFVMDNGNYKVKQYQNLEAKVRDQQNRGIYNTWEQRNLVKVDKRLNNTIYDNWEKGPTTRSFYLDDHFSGNIIYRYSGEGRSTPWVKFDDEETELWLSINGEESWKSRAHSLVNKLQIGIMSNPATFEDTKFNFRLRAKWRY